MAKLIDLQPICLLKYQFNHETKDALYFWFGISRNKKILKTPSGQSESVSRERTYDTIYKKGQKDKQRSTKHCIKLNIE